MACEVCEHCNSTVCRGERVVQQGHSYHERCHKCYVCDETNLQDAEIFMGVIFCSGCSNRIFKGCSTARKVKTRNSKKLPHWCGSRRNKRRSKLETENRVLELAKLTSITDSQTSVKSSAHSTEATVITNRSNETKKTYNLKKDSIDMETTTTVTQELLKHIHSPIEMQVYFENNKLFNCSPLKMHDAQIHAFTSLSKSASPAKPRKRRKNKRQNKHKKYNCSDPRVAELGTSTEIAHMALRRASELPVVIRSESKIKRSYHDLTYLSQDSDATDNDESKQFSSDYSSQDIDKSTHWMDRTLGSILRLPYKSFKKNILDRSSVASMSSEGSLCILRRLKTLFQDEITEHQGRGLKKLFSTINRKRIPYRLGWLEVMSRISEDEGSSELKKKRDIRCRHFRNSHSYRCMRTQAMRLAGPTRSELAVLRGKLNLFRNLRNFYKQYVSILKTVCGKLS